jgi:hypothetical protein
MIPVLLAAVLLSLLVTGTLLALIWTQMGQIGDLKWQIRAIEAIQGEDRAEIARFGAQMAILGRISAESAEIPPEVAENRPDPADGTNIRDFEAPDSPIDPMDGQIPFVNVDWTPPPPNEPETVLDEEDDDV